MLSRILAILFPLLAVVLAGIAYGLLKKPDMGFANRLNLEIFIPALVFATLAGKSFDLALYAPLAVGTLMVVLGSGLIAWPLSKLIREAPKTFVPPMMFNNSGNVGMPLAVLAFGPQALPAAVIMFLVSNLLHFSLGVWRLDHQAKLRKL